MILRLLRVTTFAAALALTAWGLVRGERLGATGWLLCLACIGVLLATSLWPYRTTHLPVFGRAMLRWVTLVSVAFLLISIQLARVQIVESARTLERVETAPNGDVVMDPRRRLAEFDERRGRILDAEGRVLAETLPTDDGGWTRTWPEPSTWGLTGYYSPLLYGSTNLESAFDGYLSGQEGGSAAREWLNNLLHLDREGYDLHLTIDL
ncbi:MAG: penicillin-binding protein 2, partial [Chloroflexi bacterium]